VNKDIDVILIENAAHHLDLRTPNDSDPKSVIDARRKEIDIIRRWLELNREDKKEKRDIEGYVN